MAYITENIIILNTRTSLGHNVSHVNFWQGQAFWLQAAIIQENLLDVFPLYMLK